MPLLASERMPMIYDFRSDAVTHSTKKIRQAMTNVPVGDDMQINMVFFVFLQTPI